MKFIISAFLQFLPFFVLGQSLPKAQDYLDRSDYKNAVPLYEKITNEAKLNHNLDLQVTAQNGLADCYIDLGATYKAMAILKQNIDLLNKATSKNYLLLAKTHQLLAICYDKLFLLEDYLKETNTFYCYYKKASPEKEIYKALYFAYVGRYYNMRFMVNKAFVYTNAALKIYHKNKKQKEVDTYIFYNAHLFTERNHAPTLAIKFQYVDSLRYFINKRYPFDNLKKARLMVSLAAPNIEVAVNLYYRSGDYNLNITCADRAISHYNEAIAMNDKLAGFYHPNAANLNSLKGLMYFYKKDYKKALENYDIGIKRLTISPYIFTNNNAVLFDLLKWKAWCLDDMYIQNNDTKLLFEIEKTLLLEEKYWVQYANTVFKSKERFNTNGYCASPYSAMTKNYYKLYKATGIKRYIDLYFEYDEKSKYSGLLENLYKERKGQAGNISDNSSIKTYEGFDNLLLKINGKIILNEDVKSTFDKRYKMYVSKQEQTDLFTKEKLVSLKDVQNKLKENEAVLSFNVYDYQGHFIPFVLVVSNDIIKVVEFKDLSNTSDHEILLFNLLERLNQNTIYKYEKEAFEYYKNYFKPVESYLSKNITHIKIIPSASFGNFPFELLLSSASTSNDFSKLPYLLNKYQFSYGLSSSISNIVENNVSKSNTFSVFNPSFSFKNLTELKESNTKSQEFADLFDAHLIQGKDATKKTFSKHLENDKIVTLLSHGSASDDEIESNKGIYFSDGFLSMNEVYNLKANCDFLVLGACESGVGYKNKEGNINLARAFTAIGVKSMMLASWKIDEKSSVQIISSFLKYLDSGCTKSEALQKAKLDYLAAASPRMANPLYWAGLNITGNNETIRLQQQNYWSLVLGLFVVVGLLVGRKFVPTLFRSMNKLR
jgi:CHAT domain-containing protein